MKPRGMTITPAEPSDQTWLRTTVERSILEGAFCHLEPGAAHCAETWLEDCLEIWVARAGGEPVAFGALTHFLPFAAMADVLELTVLGHESGQVELLETLEHRARALGGHLALSASTSEPQRQRLDDRGYATSTLFPDSMADGLDVRLMQRFL